MSIFTLPDLGEGLQEAEIIEWKVKEGETVEQDQLILLVETAKAIVEVPSPQQGTISRICAQVGDIVQVGETLVEYDGAEIEREVEPAVERTAEVGENESAKAQASQDSGTVVGNLKQSSTVEVDEFRVGVTMQEAHNNVSVGSTRKPTDRFASPRERAFAMAAGLDVGQLEAGQLEIGGTGSITMNQLADALANRGDESGDSNGSSRYHYDALKGGRRVMAQSMHKAHHEVPLVTLFDDVVIDAWPKGTDVTVRLIQAMVHACEKEGALNAWFDGEELAIHRSHAVHIGIAVDTPEGLYVPVMRHAEKLQPDTMRTELDTLRQQVKDKSLSPRQLMGATISLSNFGTLAGRHATPIVVPPQVAILGAGRWRMEPRVIDDQVKPCKVLPLSLSFDHRAVTGGEAARFMAALMDDLNAG